MTMKVLMEVFVTSLERNLLKITGVTAVFVESQTSLSTGYKW